MKPKSELKLQLSEALFVVHRISFALQGGEERREPVSSFATWMY